MRRWWPIIAILALAVGGYAAYDRSRYEPFENATLMVRFFYDEDPLAGAPFATFNDVTGIGGEQPLESWACFKSTYVPAFDKAAVASDPTPPAAPLWQSCFDADKIGADIAAGKAKAYALQPFPDPMLAAVAAVYPDGHGYLWREVLREPLVKP